MLTIVSYHMNVLFPTVTVSYVGNGQFSQHRLQARAVRKHFEDLETCAYHVNVFPSLEMDNFFNIAPKRAQRGKIRS